MVRGKKACLAAGIILLSAATLVACGNSSKTSKSDTKVYSYLSPGDPDTLDYIKSNRETTSNLTAQGVDGLLVNDKYGNLVPAIAKDWKVSKDGLTYTYTLRDDAKWYTSDGEEYADVTAKDFVTGLKHAADTSSEALYIVQDSIKGLADYVSGKNKDFSSVGIKALDDHTVQYTLNTPETYWNSKLTYGVLYPLNEEFMKSKGKDFGTVDPSSILYNGPFIIKSIVSKSVMELEKNEHYYDADKVKVDKIKLAYDDGTDPDSLYRNFADGVYTGTRLYPSKSSYKEAEAKYGKNILYGSQDATSWYIGFNLDRKAYEFTSKDDKQKADAKTAILNKDFRQAFAFAFDREAYSAQINGKESAAKSLRNLFVPPGFVSSNGKSFGDMVKEELADNSAWSDVNLADAQDGIYNPEKAKASFAKAKADLEAKGVSFPIHLDLPVSQTSELIVQAANSLKQSVEANLGKENVVVDVQKLSEDDAQRVTYFFETAEQADYDLIQGGWTPDYDDPSSYLDNFRSDTGTLFKNLGLDNNSTSPVVSEVGLDAYTNLVKEAATQTTDLDARYKAYAKAQAFLQDSSVITMIRSNGGAPRLSRVVPYTGSYSETGNKGSSSFTPYMKTVELQEEPVTAKEYEAAKKKWLEEKKKSNEAYAKDLVNHVEK